MSNLFICEKLIDVEEFISELAVESSNMIAQKIPQEYRASYLSSYAAGLLLSQNNNEERYV